MSNQQEVPHRQDRFSRMEAFLTERRSAYREDVAYITNIDSGTGQQEGSKAIVRFLQERLQAAGAACDIIETSQGRHLVARRNGRGQKRFLLIAHTDTVFPAGTAEERPFQMTGERTAAGPGVGDDKASVIQLLYLIEAMAAQELNDFATLTAYFDAEEETGSDAETKLLQQLAQEADAAFILDTGRPHWGIIGRRKGSDNYTLTVKGKTGHAGNAPHLAANAVVELAHQLLAGQALASPLPGHPDDFTPEKLAARGERDYGQYIPAVTINVSHIATENQNPNQVPGDAFARLEVRAYESSDLERVEQGLRQAAAKPLINGTCVKLERQQGTRPFRPDSGGQQLISLYKEIVAERYNAQVTEWYAGGVSLSNTTAQFIPTLDAVGVDCNPLTEHTAQERVDFSTFVPRTAVLIELLCRLDEQASDNSAARAPQDR